MTRITPKIACPAAANGDWWPADCGHCEPLFIRMTWHAAGTYRTGDGRGGEDEWLGDQRRADTRQSPENPLAAVQMGLICVNPEGPGANPDPLLSAQDVRETFGRMAMNDEETVALVAGGDKFRCDFVAAWDKVMNADRFDLEA